MLGTQPDTINAAIMVGNEKIAPEVQNGITDAFDKRLDHNISFLLSSS